MWGLALKYSVPLNNLFSNYLIVLRRKMSTLTQDEIFRYGRQILLPQIGPEGQMKMKNSSVLIVGCGGLGCPSAQYLTAAGIGRIGLVDNDAVEISNLHRQILHAESNVGRPKTESAAEALAKINSNTVIDKYQTRLTPANAFDIVEKYDIVVDATDNATTRYLLSDVCVLSKRPLVSGAALRFDGQLTVYNYDESAPCYRCLFPSPPPAGTVTNCSEGGVLGVVPGIIGTMQAMEAMKIAMGLRPSYAGRMLLFDGLDGTIRTVKIRTKRDDCVACGSNPTVTRDLMDYDQFVGTPQCAPKPLEILQPDERVSVHEYKEILDNKENHVLIDVRPEAEAKISRIDHSINIPLKQLQSEEGIAQIKDILANKSVEKIFVHCRRGNASQMAVRFLKDNLDLDQEIKDIQGGITAWSDKVDPNVPLY